jgi:phosphoglycerate dehydrogenase-like enzyme
MKSRPRVGLIGFGKTGRAVASVLLACPNNAGSVRRPSGIDQASAELSEIDLNRSPVLL